MKLLKNIKFNNVKVHNTKNDKIDFRRNHIENSQYSLIDYMNDVYSRTVNRS
jgi:hypothetical protein